MKRRVRITADCVCDLPPNILREYDIPVIYFYVVTDSGCFMDKSEITARNMVEYFENGGTQIATLAPKVEEYREFFGEELALWDEVVHLCITSKLSKSYEHACEAAKSFGGRVHVFDTENLSTGMGHLVLQAVKLAEQGMESEQVVEALQRMKQNAITTFIAQNTHNLYLAGRMSKAMDTVCRVMKMRPILKMKQGELKLSGILIGSFPRCVSRYIRRELKNSARIDKRRLLITHCGCPVRTVNLAKRVSQNCCGFDRLDVAEASATISGNCGANTIGVIYMRI